MSGDTRLGKAIARAMWTLIGIGLAIGVGIGLLVWALS